MRLRLPLDQVHHRDLRLLVRAARPSFLQIPRVPRRRPSRMLIMLQVHRVQRLRLGRDRDRARRLIGSATAADAHTRLKLVHRLQLLVRRVLHQLLQLLLVRIGRKLEFPVRTLNSLYGPRFEACLRDVERRVVEDVLELGVGEVSFEGWLGLVEGLGAVVVRFEQVGDWLQVVVRFALLARLHDRREVERWGDVLVHRDLGEGERVLSLVSVGCFLEATAEEHEVLLEFPLALGIVGAKFGWIFFVSVGGWVQAWSQGERYIIGKELAYRGGLRMCEIGILQRSGIRNIALFE